MAPSPVAGAALITAKLFRVGLPRLPVPPANGAPSVAFDRNRRVMPHHVCPLGGKVLPTRPPPSFSIDIAAYRYVLLLAIASPPVSPQPCVWAAIPVLSPFLYMLISLPLSSHGALV